MIRLNKFLSQAGVTSRRKADQLIQEGKVRVNGEVVKDLGFKVDPTKDTIEVEGKQVKPQEKKVYIKIYKPRGYLSELGKDKFGRKTLTDLLQEVGIEERVFPAGRLDYDSEGLLLLTNDGDIAYKITHPKHDIKKEYILQLQGIVDEEKFEKMKKGIELEDGFFKPDYIKILKKEKNSIWIEVKIHSGKKRILRRYFQAFGYKVLRLIRVKIGNIHIGKLKPKEYEYIPKSTILSLVKESHEKRDSFK
ncbi:MAG: pseudouridine synthase [Hydrogenothermaceae bacterium]